MAYKIYTKGAQFYIEDTTTDRLFQGHAKNVLVRRSITSSDDFYFEYVNEWDRNNGST